MSTRVQWIAILGGFLVLVLVVVVLGAIVGATKQSSDDAEQASSSEAESEEPAGEESTSEEVAEETFESFEEEERRKASRPEPRTPEERIRRNVEDLPRFGTEPVWVNFYDDNGCLDVEVKYRTSEPLFGILTQAVTTEGEMEPIYEAIHGDRETHEAVCDTTVAAFGDAADDYGQKTEEKLYQTTISRDKASRVNWSDVGAVNFRAVWRVDYIHPEVEDEEFQENDREVVDCTHDRKIMEQLKEEC